MSLDVRSLASDLGADLRYALRRLRRTPGFTAVAVTSLAIGIGAPTAIFNIARTLLLRPLGGLVEPERLVEVGRTRDHDGFDTLSWLDFADYRAQASSFESMFGYELTPLYARADGASELVAGLTVTSGYFETLGVRPAFGRFFTPEEEKPGPPPVAVASHDYWRARLGADPAALGRTLMVNGSAVTLVGVAQPEFRGHVVALAPDLYLPTGALAVTHPTRAASVFEERNGAWIQAAGRLRPGVAMAAAEVELQAIAARNQPGRPAEFGEISVRLAPLRPLPEFAHGPMTLFSTLLFVLAGLVLLVAASNVAGMTLARTAARTRELGVRQALGAGARRLARQLLIETLMLFALALPLAVGVAFAATRLASALRPPTPVPIRIELALDLPSLLFASLLALATGVAFGLIPAFRAARRDATLTLREAAPTTLERLFGRKLLVAAQLALSVVLLSAAAYLGRALERAGSIDIGFEPSGVESFPLDLELAGYRDVDGRQALGALLERLELVPGVERAAHAAVLPSNFESMGYGGVVAEGATGDAAPEFGFGADVNVVTPEFFDAIDLSVRGRGFDARDTASSPPVAVVTAAFARQLWGDRDPLGLAFVLDPQGDKRRIEVVGIVRDARWRSLGSEPEPLYFLSSEQFYRGRGYVLLETRGDRAAIVRSVAAEVAAFDLDLPRPQLARLADVVANSTLPQRVAASVAGSLGAVGAALAALGLYGLLAYAVARRGKEIAVRVALGASRREIVRLVLHGALRPIAIGAAFGIVASIALGFALGGLLFGLPPLDPAALGAAPLVLVLVALVAALVPARRALAVSPASALRSE